MQILVDCGYTHAFINREVVQKLLIPVNDVPGQTLDLSFPNGTRARSQLQTAKVEVKMASHFEEMSLIVCDLKQYDVILGRPWLAKHNPHLNWRTNDVRFRNRGRSVHFVADATFENETIWRKEFLRSINAVEATQLVNDHGYEIFAINVRLAPGSTTASNGVRIADPDPRLFKLHQEYMDVFPEKLTELPSSRGRFDHKIDLVDERVASGGYPVRFSTLEVEILQEMIDDMIAKGFISPSNSPFGAPCFFVRKAHSNNPKDLRLVVDWRNLNNNTIKDKTQLPNIADLIALLHRARYFSVLDGHSGFWQILLRKEDRHKTAFRTPFGNYEWNVMGMGLTNAPATYQTLMNQMFKPFLRKFVAVYLDDVLVYSNTLQEHLQHLRQVLDILRANKVACKPSKCVLGASSVLFLGHIIGHGEIRTDPEKVRKIIDMKEPTNKSELRTFLGMCEYLAGHLVHYAEIAWPLTEATHKDTQFFWSDSCQRAFMQLKSMIPRAPVLLIPDPEKPFIVASDASIHSGSAVLIQIDERGRRRPVAYYSRKWTQSEFKWATRDKEARAMLDAIEHWSTYLKGRYFTVESDHHSLQHLRTQKDLLPRQERLLDVLADYNFDIHYVAGPKNGGPDGLSRLAELASLETTLKTDQEFLDKVRVSYNDNEFFKRILKRLHSQNKPSVREAWMLEDGLLWFRGLSSEHPRLAIGSPILQIQLMKEAHDSLFTNHQGIEATSNLLCNKVFWPRMRLDLKDFVKSCALCQRARTLRGKTPGELQPLEIPEKRGLSYSMDFKTSLPLSKGYTAIMIVVDRLTKRSRFIPTRDDATAEETARLFFDRVVCECGLPESIVCDRDPKFTSDFWKHLFKCLGTNLKMSTSDHPQSDGQTERTIRTLKERLITLVNHVQDNWAQLLPLVEFQYNSSIHSAIGMSPFEADLGRIPRSPLSTLLVVNDMNGQSQKFIDKLQSDLQLIKDNIILSQDKMQTQADKYRLPTSFAPGDQVLVEAEALRANTAQSSRPNPFRLKYDGPFKVLKKVNENAYKIDFPESFNVHSTINVEKLKRFIPNTFIEREDKGPELISTDLGEERYVHEVLAKKKSRGRPKTGGISRWKYLVHWAGERQDQASWEPEENLIDEIDGTMTEALRVFLQNEKESRGRV